LSDDVNDNEGTDERMECNGDYVELREGDSGSRKDAMSYDNCSNEMDATDSCFHRKLTVIFIGKEKMKWGKVKSSTHIRCRWQNILTKLPEVIDQAGNATTLLETWNCHDR